MSRFILRYRGKGGRPEEMVQRIRQLDGANVLDDSGRMLLVDAPEEALRQLIETQSDWILCSERVFPLPDTRKRIEHPPS